MEKLLKDFKPKESGTVKSITADGRIKRRLFDMGITPGVQIVMRKTAPLGDPIEITVRGYELTLRKTEAQAVTMEV
ncbi:MAG: ferrous iron transport protein A [Christensenellales bacterium]